MICGPLCSFEELLKWNPNNQNRPHTTPLLRSGGVVDELGTFKRPSITPLVMFCHDMAGGYHEYDVTTAKVREFPTYRFIHWDLIDIFVYFSHHFITIPPVAWTNVSHRNGVSVYGTVIIELDRERPCPAFNAIFDVNTKECFIGFPSQFAQKLDAIRQFYGFEGWLINFENRFFDKTDRRIFQRILHFLKCLKDLGSEVVWYDSVTKNGTLNWQNALSPENSHFFRSCYNGIFLNYAWTPELLSFTQNQALSSDESVRIFVGVDCFGRGCPGGGGFNTKEALELVLKASESRPDRPLSVALFAPAWSFERRKELVSSHSTNNPVNEVMRIFQLDDQFWCPLISLISQLRAVGSSSLHFYRPLSPWSGYFHTNFSLGLSLFDAKSNAVSPWSCLADQEVLPTCRVLTNKTSGESVDFIVKAMPEFMDYYSHSNSWRLRVVPLNETKENLSLEIFLFPNLSLSAIATLTIILKVEMQGLLKVFADLCTVSWDEIYVNENYPITSRQYIDYNETENCNSRGSPWKCLLANIGAQLLSISGSDHVTFVRRIGLEIQGHVETFLLGGFTLSDSQLCNL